LRIASGVAEADEDGLGGEEGESGERDKEESVAKVRDAGGDSGAGGYGGRRSLNDEGGAVKRREGDWRRAYGGGLGLGGVAGVCKCRDSRHKMQILRLRHCVAITPLRMTILKSILHRSAKSIFKWPIKSILKRPVRKVGVPTTTEWL
jgi:hypothetical protein